MRIEDARKLLQEIHFSVIRGNASEIQTLVNGTAASRGVDANEIADDPLSIAKKLANAQNCIVVLTGEKDIVTDGKTSYLVRNGHPMMRFVTGAGCQLSALTGAYTTANPEKPLEAALAAVCAMGYCGELAFRRLTEQDGNASYRNYIIEALFCLRGEALEKGANYELL